MTIRSINTSGLPQGVLTPMGDLLFAASEPGAWYDPSDLSTLFQDTAGTTPVTAVEQAVALVLDKARPIVTNGAERMNVLPSEAADWSGGDNTVVGNKLIPNTTNGGHGQYKMVTSTGLDYIIKVKAKAAGYSKFYISDASFGRVHAAYDLANGTVISAVSNIPHDAAIVYLGDGVYELSVKVNAVTALAICITPYPDTGATLTLYGASFAGDGVSGVEVYAVDARLVTQADTLPRYQYTPANTWSRFMGSTHASQATSTKRPVYSRRVNLLPSNNLGSWTKTAGATMSVASVGDVHPGSNVFKLTYDGTGSAGNYRAYIDSAPVVISTPGAGYSSFIYLRADVPVTVRISGNAVAGALTVANVTTVWQKFLITGVGNGAGTVQFLIYSAAADNAPLDLYFSSADIQLSTDAHLPYQWVNTATDYDADPAKFPAFGVSDGVDDSFSCATGGGGNAGFFFSEVIKPLGSAGANRVLFSDAGTNTGYIVRLNTSNKLELAAGNSTAYTTIATAASLDVGARDVVQAWDDGTNLNVKIGAGPTASIARPVVVAGTAGFTLGQDNGASTGYFNGARFGAVYRKDSSPTQAQREAVATYQRMKAKMP